MSGFGSRPPIGYWKHHKNEFSRQINDSMGDIRLHRFEDENTKSEKEKGNNKNNNDNKESPSKKILKD